MLASAYEIPSPAPSGVDEIPDKSPKFSALSLKTLTRPSLTVSSKSSIPIFFLR